MRPSLDLPLVFCHPAAKIPVYATEGSGAMDVSCVIDNMDGEVTLLPGQSHVFHTGLTMAVPFGWTLKVYSRSGHGFKFDTRLANGTGIIDSDYRDEVMIKLRNDGNKPVVIKSGERIAQMMLVETPRINIRLVGKLSNPQSSRIGGLGSTGTN